MSRLVSVCNKRLMFPTPEAGLPATRIHDLLDTARKAVKSDFLTKSHLEPYLRDEPDTISVVDEETGF